VTARPAGVNEQSPEQASGLEGLGAEDRSLAKRQQKCPVTGLALGSMGTPRRVVVSGQVVFLCCDGCEAKLLREPGRYLARLPQPLTPVRTPLVEESLSRNKLGVSPATEGP
jgi:hypothetical protein